MNQWKNAWRTLALLGLVWGTASAEIVWSPTDHKTNNIAANIYEAGWTSSKNETDGTSFLPSDLSDEFTALQRIPLRVRLGSASGFGLVGTSWKSTRAAQDLSSGACITYRASRDFKAEFVNTSDKVSFSVSVPASTGNGNISVSASDGSNNKEWAFSLNITDVAHAPTAAPDTFSLVEDGGLAVSELEGVLVNDSDKDGDYYFISDKSGAAQGSLVLDEATGSFTYTPVGNFCGEDFFTYTLSDGGLSSVGKVVLKVACGNDAPTLSLDTTLTLSLLEDFADTIITISASDLTITDPDGAELMVKIGTDGNTTAAINTAVHHAITLSSVKDFNGTSQVTLYVKDAAGDSAGVSFNVNIAAVIDAPVAVADAATTKEDEALTLDVVANDLNPDPLTLTQLELVDEPAHGAIVKNADYTLTYTPDANWNGTDTLFYRTAYAGGQSAMARVLITVTAVNDPVTLAAGAIVPDTSANEDFATSIKTALTPLFNDPDGDARYTVSASKGIVTAAIDQGYLILSPIPDSNGVVIITLSAQDSNDSVGISFKVTIVPVNDVPVLTVRSRAVNWQNLVEQSAGRAQLRTLQGRLVTSYALPVRAQQISADANSCQEATVLTLDQQRWLLAPAAR